jgi:dimethylaniline monooxygenase (N-oxide forming)
MPPPEDGAETGGHITGIGMCEYMETFYTRFLKDKATFKFETEILNVKRSEKGLWQVRVEDLPSGKIENLNFARIVLCTGVCGLFLVSFP